MCLLTGLLRGVDYLIALFSGGVGRGNVFADCPTVPHGYSNAQDLVWFLQHWFGGVRISFFRFQISDFKRALGSQQEVGGREEKRP